MALTNLELAECLRIQKCVFCNAFLNDGIEKLDAKNARKHLSLGHDIKSDNLIRGLIYRNEIEKSLNTEEFNKSSGREANEKDSSSLEMDRAD